MTRSIIGKYFYTISIPIVNIGEVFEADCKITASPFLQNDPLLANGNIIGNFQLHINVLEKISPKSG
jgi:hypothetical protein